MLTIEEYIKHCESEIEEYEKCLDIAMQMHDTESAKENYNLIETYKQLAAWLRELRRARVLLKATHDLLKAAEDSPYVEDVLAMLVHYDDTDCDGSCLMEDIEYYFDEFGAERRTE